ncbi:MAG: DUF924 family protein [Pseudomonadota bacterium]
MKTKLKPEDVLTFWFEEISEKDWWVGSDDFDLTVRNRFGDHLPAAEAGEFCAWRETSHGRLAEILMLDQFTRQIYRGSACAFASDTMAVALAQEAVRINAHLELEPRRRKFLIMPFMHSESLIVHDWALPLWEGLDDPDTMKFELGHRNVIERFGRYPTRNAILKRVSTDAEIEYLKNEQQGAV